MTWSRRSGSREGTEVLSLDGPFTLGNLFVFQRELPAITPGYLIFDLTGVPYMDSAGLGLLVNFYVSAEKNGRRMAIVGATPRVTALFEMTKVDSLLRTFPTVEAAEAAG